MPDQIEQLLEDAAEYAYNAAENGENLEEVKKNIKIKEASEA